MNKLPDFSRGFNLGIVGLTLCSLFWVSRKEECVMCK
jgi:hypothetical protein